jgi:hypothetical protein
MEDKKTYYQKNKELWKKNGKYYHYKPKVNTDKITIKRGVFLISFD